MSWTPTEAQGPGSYTFSVVVTDNGSSALSDSETITVTVSEVNQAPTLDPIGDQVFVVGPTFTFTATASDPDLPANTLTFSLTDQPVGATINPVTGEFTWTPTLLDQLPGVYTFTVWVSDGGSPSLTDSETITVLVLSAWPLVEIETGKKCIGYRASECKCDPGRASDYCTPGNEMCGGAHTYGGETFLDDCPHK